MILQWLRSLRRQQPVTAAEIRRQLGGLRRQHVETIERRDALALDAVRDETAAEQWLALDDTARSLARQIDVLAVALPQAEAKEAEAAREAEEAARAKRLAAYLRDAEAAQRWTDAMLARLASGDELTYARDLRDALRDAAVELRQWSNDVCVRRPLDPLDVLTKGMQHRLDRISRARWIGAHPITLGSGNTQDAIATAAARVEALERTRR